MGSWVFGFLKYRCSAACSMAVDENQPERGQHVMLPQDVMRSRVWLQDSHTASLALSEAEQCLWSNVLWGRIALPCCSLKKCFFVLFLHWNKSLVTELPPNTPWSDRSECVLTVLRCSVTLSTIGWRCSLCCNQDFANCQRVVLVVFFHPLECILWKEKECVSRNWEWLCPLNPRMS